MRQRYVKNQDEILKRLDKENISEFYRPIFYGAGIVDKRVYPKLKHYDITLVFENLDDKATKKVKRFIGFSRKNKFQNFKSLLKNEINSS